jgi:hypothetical protein
MKEKFKNKIKHIGKKYYRGRVIHWLIEDKYGEKVYCDKCGNIANGVWKGKILGFNYMIPLCKNHFN